MKICKEDMCDSFMLFIPWIIKFIWYLRMPNMQFQVFLNFMLEMHPNLILLEIFIGSLLCPFLSASH